MVRESEVLFILRDAANDGRFADFSVSAITGTRDTPIMATSTSSSDGMLPQHIMTFCPV